MVALGLRRGRGEGVRQLRVVPGVGLLRGGLLAWQAGGLLAVSEVCRESFAI